jgi:hypothetical protein
VQKMRAGLAKPAVRSRLQISSGRAQRDERKQTADDVSKAYGRCRNRWEVVNPGLVWGVS